MAYRDRGVVVHFSQPVRQIMMMAIVLIAVAGGGYVALPRIGPVFLTNPWLNGFIAFVFFIGLLACFYQVYELIRSVSWIEAFTREIGEPPGSPSRLLAPLATLMRQRGARAQISASSSRSILDSVSTRIEEARDITRYLSTLLIFLGLLGTFYGLATTVPEVVDTIRSLAPKPGEGSTDVFGRLMSGLQNQLGGMGTAFASSLLGLTGSLIIGLLELFANHGQNRFYRELEDWLSSITRLGYAGAEGEGSADAQILAAFAEQMAEQMDALTGVVTASEQGRAQTDGRIGDLAQAVEELANRIESGLQDRNDSGATALSRIAEGQDRMVRALEAQGARAEAIEGQGGAHVDVESRMRLRSIDVQLLRILEEMAAGRQESQAELRADLAALTKAVRQLGGAQPVPIPPAQARRG